MDYKISEKLNYLADNTVLPERILAAALTELRKQKSRKTFNFNFRLLTQISAIAACIIVIAVSLMLLRPKNNEHNIESYKLNSLTAVETEFADISALSDKDILLFDYPIMSSECTAYYKDDELMLISIDYTVVSSSGTEQIKVYIDLRRGLSDFTHYKLYEELTVSGKQIRIYEFYENGEYYTRAYFDEDGVNYYLELMSPEDDRGLSYLSDLLAGQN